MLQCYIFKPQHQLQTITCLCLKPVDPIAKKENKMQISANKIAYEMLLRHTKYAF